MTRLRYSDTEIDFRKVVTHECNQVEKLLTNKGATSRTVYREIRTYNFEFRAVDIRRAIAPNFTAYKLFIAHCRRLLLNPHDL